MLEAEALIDGHSYPLTYEDGSFTAAIPAADIAQLDSFELQVRLSDGVNTFMSEPMRVTAQEGAIRWLMILRCSSPNCAQHRQCGWLGCL